MIKKILNSDSSALLIPIFGVCCQGISWMIVFAFTIIFDFISKGNVSPITYAGAGIVFFMPIISLLGIYISIRNLIKKEKIMKNLIALLLNFTWLSFLVIVLLIMLLHPDLIVSV